MELRHFKGIIVLMRIEQAPYLIRILCLAHKNSLVIQSLSTMPMVSKLEALLQTLYGYFFSSRKRCFEFTKLVEIVHIKGLKGNLECENKMD
jgi:hypothetical protein